MKYTPARRPATTLDRARPVLQALGLTVEPPRCSGCHSGVDFNEASGSVSLRCRNLRCRLGRLGWQWSEMFAAELWRTPTIKEARTRLVETVQRQEGSTKAKSEAHRSSRHIGARARLATIFGSEEA